jgi:hypothetical protein
MKTFFGFLFSMVTFDYLPIDVLYDELTGTDEDAASEVLGDIGYDAISSVRNLGSVFVGLCLIPLGIIIMNINSLCTKRVTCCKKIEKKCKREKTVETKVKSKCQTVKA